MPLVLRASGDQPMMVCSGRANLKKSHDGLKWPPSLVSKAYRTLKLLHAVLHFRHSLQFASPSFSATENSVSDDKRLPKFGEFFEANTLLVVPIPFVLRIVELSIPIAFPS